MRTTTNVTYRLAPAGANALRAERSVPDWYRSILGLMNGDTTANKLVDALAAYPRKQVLSWIGELETLGFIFDANPEPPGLIEITVSHLQVDLTLVQHPQAA